MDSELKCNRLTCRRPLTDKAVVTTCSHIFCIDCANELFGAARLCPACETNLTEPDDVVVCSLQPTNDYKTSVLSGLMPSTILEICSRAISFWQYQVHQENTFQQAVVRNVNDKNAQLQKQLDNVVREANGEMNLLNNKKAELERDLELERRKVRELQEGSRERDKEYQKLKIQFDKIKRKALFGPPTAGLDDGHPQIQFPQNQFVDDQRSKPRLHVGSLTNNSGLAAVVGGMEANGIQRTPLVTRTNGGAFMTNQQQITNDWVHSNQRPTQSHSRNISHRQQFGGNFQVANAGDRSRSAHASDRSGSANEVDNLLMNPHSARTSVPTGSGWHMANPPQSTRTVQRGKAHTCGRSSR
ncbi:hypothetical protein B0H34DRAFT_220653 [Crassisporium funariophilum]|nr:hypothetical protein B0H34DRAFT_220653 [Crassisporium funariophilum]